MVMAMKVQSMSNVKGFEEHSPLFVLVFKNIKIEKG